MRALLLASRLFGAPESGLAMANLMLSLSATALIILVAYYGGSFWGEDARELIAPAFDWR